MIVSHFKNTQTKKSKQLKLANTFCPICLSETWTPSAKYCLDVILLAYESQANQLSGFKETNFIDPISLFKF